MTSFNAFSVVIKVLVALVTSKLTAIFLGPSGLTLLGNLRNSIAIFQKFSSAGVENAVVKYAVETRDKEEERRKFQTTLFFYVSLFSFLTMLACLVFAEVMSNYIFGESTYAMLIRFLGLILPLYVANTLLLALLRAHGFFSRVIKINSISYLVNLVLFSILIYFYGLSGAMFTLVVLPSILFFVTLAFAYQTQLVFVRFSKALVSKELMRSLGEFSIMTLISGLSFPLAYLSIRQLLTHELSSQDAGYWEAIFRISNLYLMFVITLLNLILLPKLAEAKNLMQFRQIVFNFYKNILPLFFGGLILVYFLKEWIIRLVLTEEFLPVEDLFLWQMIGDVFRVLALVMVCQFHAKKMFWHYILTDLFLAVSLYLSTYGLIDIFGLKSVVIGHALTYFIYFLIVLYIFRKPMLLPKALSMNPETDY